MTTIYSGREIGKNLPDTGPLHTYRPAPGDDPCTVSAPPFNRPSTGFPQAFHREPTQQTRSPHRLSTVFALHSIDSRTIVECLHNETQHMGVEGPKLTLNTQFLGYGRAALRRKLGAIRRNQTHSSALRHRRRAWASGLMVRSSMLRWTAESRRKPQTVVETVARCARFRGEAQRASETPAARMFEAPMVSDGTNGESGQPQGLVFPTTTITGEINSACNRSRQTTPPGRAVKRQPILRRNLPIQDPIQDPRHPSLRQH